MLHVFTAAEKALLDNPDGRSFGCGSFRGPARPGPPDMGWKTAFGGDRRSNVDMDRLRAAGFPVTPTETAITVQVTDRLADVVEDFAGFQRRRAELKRLLPPDLFRARD